MYLLQYVKRPSEPGRTRTEPRPQPLESCSQVANLLKNPAKGRKCYRLQICAELLVLTGSGEDQTSAFVVIALDGSGLAKLAGREQYTNIEGPKIA
jgi:hypothetical protein